MCQMSYLGPGSDEEGEPGMGPGARQVLALEASPFLGQQRQTRASGKAKVGIPCFPTTDLAPP